MPAKRRAAGKTTATRSKAKAARKPKAAAKPKAKKATSRPAAATREKARSHCIATDPFGDPCQSAPRLPSKHCTIHSYLDR